MTETSSGRGRRRADARGQGAAGDDPFALLGLPARPGLSDDDVRAAWRRIAAATHPDREDGGDPAGFGAAAAAYVVLRTEFGRGEALADLGLSGTTGHRGRHAHRRGRSADPSAQGAGRHRARRGAPAGQRAGVRLPGVTGLRDWIARRPAPHDPADAKKREPTEATAHVPGEATARGWGDAAAHGPADAAAGESRDPAARPSRVATAHVSIRRPSGPALRVAAAAAMGVIAIVISGWSPGVVGVLVGVLTWLLATAGHAFSRRRSR